MSKKIKQLADSLESYEEGYNIVLSMLKSMGERWGDKVIPFKVPPTVKGYPVGTVGVMLAPVVAKEGNEGGTGDTQTDNAM